MSIFNKVQAKRPRSNTFDLSYQRKMSLNMGELTPIHVMECVPGDVVKMSTSQLLRFAPMVAPIMHQVNVYTHFFFVPNRLLWASWEDFITGGVEGTNDSVFPFLAVSEVTNGTLADYLGLPNWGPADPRQVSAMPFAAYQMIYNEYYRDQNLIDPVEFALEDGNNAAITNDLIALRRRAWQHDYFTSALPWTQRGPEATIPLGGEADITGSAANTLTFTATDGPSTVHKADGSAVGASSNLGYYESFAGSLEGIFDSDTGEMSMDITSHTSVSPGPDWAADLSSATAASINDLRQAFRLQEWLEKNARGGARYIESVLSHFGVRSSDARLNRPEFLGGGSSPVVISEVLQTSDAAAEETPQGNMAGHGISAGANNSFKYRCEEHGYIIGIMSVMPKTAYQQGIPKHFRKFDKFDYYWPSFAHLGEQPIYNWELYTDTDGEDEEVFGYTPRYAEYKYNPDTVHGEFRSSLDIWHMGRIFDNRPNLNQEFVECNPTDRIFAVENAEKMYAQVQHRISAKRLMPYFGTPTL